MVAIVRTVTPEEFELNLVQQNKGPESTQVTIWAS
jgi:hypothetical protein